MTLPNPRHEAFAQARADGQTQRAAAVTAGYSRKSSIGSVLTKNKTIIDRIGAIQRAKEATSLETMIQTLMKYADTASKAGSGAGMAAARGLIAEAAKLRMATM
jgi:phage terminase small subunit